MNIFDNIFGNWIQVIDEQNSVTIEDFDYATGVIDGVTMPHCTKCVAVNCCWFKNEKNKKPQPFDNTKIKLIDYLIKGLFPGLYHPMCHCQEISMPTPSFNSIQLIIPVGKIEWLFLDKSPWIKAMGYNPNQEFIDILKNKIVEAYCCGKYESIEHTKYGFKINLMIDLPGINDKMGKIYKIKSNFMVFPNGKLKCNTLIGGWQK